MAIKVKHIKREFVDERGYISRVVDQDEFALRAVLYIKRKRGSRGADHFHKKDAHFIYVQSGKVRFSEADMTKKNPKTETVILNPGDVVLSRPMFAHSTEFLADSIIFAYTTENRNQDAYEKDTIRVDIFKK